MCVCVCLSSGGRGLIQHQGWLDGLVPCRKNRVKILTPPSPHTSLPLPLAPSCLILPLCLHHPNSIAKFTLASSHLIVIPRLPSSVFVLLLPSAPPKCLCFIECRCDYMGFCVCLTGVKGILSQIFSLYLYYTSTHTQTNTNTYTQTHTHTHTQHNVSSPL